MSVRFILITKHFQYRLRDRYVDNSSYHINVLQKLITKLDTIFKGRYR